MARGMPFTPIITKIRPPFRRADRLYRARLLDFLHEHIDRKLLLISAGAGYGKTTLLVDFVHDTDLTTCWYTLDPTDRDPQTFVEYLLATLSHAFPDFGQQTRQALHSGISLSQGAEELVGTLINEMVESIPEWFLIILDDFQEVEDSDEVCALLTTLLTYLPEHCHFIIASRTIPGGLPFISLAARGQVAGMGQDDLRFTPEEVQSFLAQSQGVYLTREEAEALTIESEGWITGILLTRHALWTGLLESMSRARRSGQPIYEYLAGEVLERQRADVRDFLLMSSTLQEMSHALCKEALGLEGAEEMLEYLEQCNLFIARLSGTEPPRFRYHALFRDFLQTRLREQDPERFRLLHQRVAAWFEQHNQSGVAIQHYLDAGAVPEVARILDATARDLLKAGRLVTLAEWADRLPEAVLHAHPRLLLSAAMAISARGRSKQALDWLSRAERTFRKQGDLHLLGLTYSRRALLLFHQGENDRAAALAQEALSTVEGLPESLEVAVEAHRILGLSLIRLSRFEEAVQHLEAALQGSRTLGDLHQEVLILGGLAHCLHWQGRSREAVEIQQAVIEIARQLGSPGYLAEALNDLGFYLSRVGEYSEALKALQEALYTARRIGHPVVEAYALVSLGELLRDLGELQAAIEVLDKGRTLAEEIGNVFLTAWTYDALALALLQVEAAEQAVDLARSALSLADQQQSRRLQGRFRASLGLTLVKEGATEAGLEELQVACETLEQIGATEEAIRARLMRARALQEAGREIEALRALQEILEGERPINRIHLQQIPGSTALLEQGVALGIGGERSARLQEEVRQLTRAVRRARSQYTAVEPPPAPTFRFYGFGIGRVERNGTPIPANEWESAKARHLLFYLLCNSPRTREQIGADLWPDLRPSRLPGTFHNTKYRVQQALGINPFVYKEGTYEISEELKYWFDVEVFGRLIHRAQQAVSAQAARYLSQAVALYTDDFLSECYDEWCLAWRERLQRQLLTAVETLSEWLIERGRFQRAEEVLQRGLQVDHLREDFHRQLMRVYALQGRREEALAHYRRCGRILKRDLGIAPMPETQALARQIRRGEVGPPSYGRQRGR